MHSSSAWRRIQQLALVCALVVVTWTLGCFEPNEQQVWRDKLRLPAYFPPYLQLEGVSEKPLAGEHGLKPGAEWAWEGFHLSPVPPGAIDYIKSPGVIMVQVGAVFDLDMGGDRRSIQVDGVTGWFTRLGAEDFSPPADSPVLGLTDTWPQEAREQSGYSSVLGQRRTPAFQVGMLYTGWCYIQACCKQIKATEPRRASSLLLYPLVPRCSLFSLSLSAECLPSFRLASRPLPTTCRLAGSKSYTT